MSEYLEKIRAENLITDEFSEFENRSIAPGKLFIIARPKEPYAEILDFFLSLQLKKIIPQDSESKILIPYILIVDSINEAVELSEKNDSGAVILKSGRVIVWGKGESIILAVMYGAVCYALYIKFFSLMLEKKRKNNLGGSDLKIVDTVRGKIAKYSLINLSLIQGPFKTKTEIIEGIKIAGKELVTLGLVNSFFGNISYRFREKIYISKTGAFLDSLDNGIVECNIKGNDVCVENASSEFPSHLKIYKMTGYGSIIHGHPPFTVILSMDCDIEECQKSKRCFYTCNYEREVSGIPIVSGKTGSGRYGLDRVLPDKINRIGKAIVYGHGIFIAGKEDFREAVSEMRRIEEMCKEEYFKKF